MSRVVVAPTLSVVVVAVLVVGCVCADSPPPIHPAEVLGAVIKDVIDLEWPDIACVVGSGHASLLVASLLHQGYTAFGMTNGKHDTDWGPTASATSLTDHTPADLLLEAVDVTQHLEYTTGAVSPPTSPVVVALDVGQYMATATEARKFVRSLTAGKPRLVVFSAATEGEGVLRRGDGAAFPNESPPGVWVELFRGEAYVLDVASTVDARNLLLSNLEQLHGGYWFPKNILVFRRRGDEAARMDARRQLLVDAQFVGVRWFTLDALGPSPLKEHLMAGALQYQTLVRDQPWAVTPSSTPTPTSMPTPPTPPVPQPPVPAPTPTPTPTPTLTLSDLTPDRDLLAMYLDGAHNELHGSLLRDLTILNNVTVTDLQTIDRWVGSFLYLMSRPDFNVVQIAHGAQYLQNVRLIAELVTVSHHRSTDAALNTLSSNPKAMVQMLALYSPYNELRISASQLWPSRALFADVWYNDVMQLALNGALANPVFFRRMHNLTMDMIELVQSPEGRDVTAPLGQFWHQYEYYFTVAYIAPEKEGVVKFYMNSYFQRIVLASHLTEGGRALAQAPPRQHNGRRILVVSAQWKSGHSVYRNFYQYVKALQLSPAFEVSLMFLESDQIGEVLLDRTGFHTVKVVTRSVQAAGMADAAAWVKAQSFDAIFYPEIGMHACDVVFANQRLAPVQVTSYGHSTSTHGALIDYFIGGEEVEMWEHKHGAARYTDRPAKQQLTEYPQRRYSERLVLIPGLGIVFNVPPMARPLGVAKQKSALIINCVWTVTKVNAPHLAVLGRIVDTVQRAAPTRLHFRFFMGVKNEPGTPASTMLLRELSAALRVAEYPDLVSVEAPRGLGYVPYMQLAASAHLALDSFPFGGCNTVFDMLFAGVPIVSMAGKMWRNRIGPAVLHRVGLGHELVVHTEAQYVAKAVNLIMSKKVLAKLGQRVADLTLKELTDVTEAQAYVGLFQHLIALNGTMWRVDGGGGGAGEKVSNDVDVDGMTDRQRVRRANLDELHALNDAAQGRLHGDGRLRNQFGGPLREGDPLAWPEPVAA